jgi:hypothetical protein
MIQMGTYFRSRNFLKLFGVSLLLALAFCVGSTKSAYAMSLNPDPSGTIPADIQTSLESCDSHNPLQSPGFEQWISPAGQPTTTSITVPDGTPYIDLEYHFVGAVCASNSAVTDTDTFVENASATTDDPNIPPGTINGIVGSILSLHFSGDYQKIGAYRHDSKVFRYFPDGGSFNKTHTITIELSTKVINSFKSGVFLCVKDGSPASDWNDFGACPAGTPTFPLFIQVEPPESKYPDGDFNWLSCDGAEGWAFDSDNYAAKLDIHLYYDSPGNLSRRQTFGPGNPNIPGQYEVVARQDVNDAYGGRPGLGHGFKIPGWQLGQFLNDAYPHTVYAYAIGVNSAGNQDGKNQFLGKKKVGPCTQPTCSGLELRDQATNQRIVSPEVGQTFTATFGAVYGGITPISQAQGAYAIYQKGAALSLKSGHIGPKPTTPYYDPYTVTIRNITISQADEYTFHWTYEWPTEDGTQQIDAGNGRHTCTPIFTVSVRPYFRVYGNDVQAGGTFTNNSSCTISEVYNPKATILAFNRVRMPWNAENADPNSPSYEQWSGSASQYAAFALGEINQFMTVGQHSARRNNNGFTRTSAISDLTFGNYHPDREIRDYVPSVGPNHPALDNQKVIHYGGESGMPSCAEDWFAHNQGNISKGPLTLPGVKVPGGVVNPGEKTALYVDGDVFIDSNINFVGGGWGTPNNNRIPSFYLIVKGNIYIDASVSQLDGVYIAQPTGVDAAGKPTDGKIYTCAVNKRAPHTSELYSDCNKKLTVNGSFIAQEVKLQRTKGTLRLSQPAEARGSGNIAEVFNFTPETYLAKPHDSLIDGSVGSEYDFITSLPPIL